MYRKFIKRTIWNFKIAKRKESLKYTHIPSKEQVCLKWILEWFLFVTYSVQPLNHYWHAACRLNSISLVSQYHNRRKIYSSLIYQVKKIYVHIILNGFKEKPFSCCIFQLWLGHAVTATVNKFFTMYKCNQRILVQQKEIILYIYNFSSTSTTILYCLQ